MTEKTEFRKMRRFKQQVSEEECRRILAEEKRGVLSVKGENGYPYGLPINFYYNPENGKIYFHGARTGHKIDALRADPKVCFTTWNSGFQKEGDWAWNVTSVIAFGRISFVEDGDFALAMCRQLAIKYYPDLDSAEAEVARDGARAQMLELTIDHLSGKLVNES